MQKFKNKVAVITGSASGIGRAIAERCAQEGMKIVLADIEEKVLKQTEQALKATGAVVMAVQTDVSKASDVEALAQETLKAFGGVHLFFNNAGVGAGTTIWESTVADWEWVLGVNLWGVIHGIRVFVPIMLKQNITCHIVNTASITGLIAGSGLGVYNVSKHGVVSLSETLYYELSEIQAKIKVSVLCPGGVQTKILNSNRNRPPELQNAPGSQKLSPENKSKMEAMVKTIQTGLSPQHVADSVFEAIRNEQFYILTQPEWKPLIRHRMENILQGRNPT